MATKAKHGTPCVRQGMTQEHAEPSAFAPRRRVRAKLARTFEAEFGRAMADIDRTRFRAKRSARARLTIAVA